MQRHLKEELAHLSLGDKRRDKRFVKIVEQKIAHPTLSIPEMGSNWSEVKLTYGFYNNDKVREAQLAAVVEKATVDRCAGQPIILHVMDTTNVGFSSSAEGLGYLDHGLSEGLMVHTSLALDAVGCPLGVLHQKIWARDPSQMGKKSGGHKKTSHKRKAIAGSKASKKRKNCCPV